MPSQKGINNFEEFQEKKVSGTEEHIRRHLNILKELKLEFSSFRQLALYLCGRIDEERKLKLEAEIAKECIDEKPNTEPVTEKMAASTFYRNDRYRVQLLDFLAYQEKRGFSDNGALQSLAESEARYTAVKVELALLKKKYGAINSFLEKSGSTIQRPQKIASDNEKGVSNEDFSCAVQALKLVLESSEGTLEIENNQIVNKTRLANNIVVDKKILKPVVRWIDQMEVTNG